MSEHADTKKVSWTIFTWAIALLVISIGVAITYASAASSKADSVAQDVSSLDSKVTSIDARTTAQFAEIIRSLERLEKANGITR